MIVRTTTNPHATVQRGVVDTRKRIVSLDVKAPLSHTQTIERFLLRCGFRLDVLTRPSATAPQVQTTVDKHTSAELDELVGLVVPFDSPYTVFARPEDLNEADESDIIYIYAESPKLGIATEGMYSLATRELDLSLSCRLQRGQRTGLIMGWMDQKTSRLQNAGGFVYNRFRDRMHTFGFPNSNAEEVTPDEYRQWMMVFEWKHDKWTHRTTSTRELEQALADYIRDERFDPKGTIRLTDNNDAHRKAFDKWYGEQMRFYQTFTNLRRNDYGRLKYTLLLSFLRDPTAAWTNVLAPAVVEEWKGQKWNETELARRLNELGVSNADAWFRDRIDPLHAMDPESAKYKRYAEDQLRVAVAGVTAYESDVNERSSPPTMSLTDKGAKRLEQLLLDFQRAVERGQLYHLKLPPCCVNKDNVSDPTCGLWRPKMRVSPDDLS
jgi:hypothetical protein